MIDSCKRQETKIGNFKLKVELQLLSAPSWGHGLGSPDWKGVTVLDCQDEDSIPVDLTLVVHFLLDD